MSVIRCNLDLGCDEYGVCYADVTLCPERCGRLKYVVYPGTVASKNDGRSHFISYEQLIALYKVDKRECIRENARAKDAGCFVGLLQLFPRFDGNYSIDVAPLIV